MTTSTKVTTKSFVKRALSTAVLGVVLTASVNVFAALDHSLETEKAITTASFQYDKAALEQLVERSEGYDKAYALYRLAQVTMQSPESAAAVTYVKDAATILDAIDDAEADALKAAVLGINMGLEPQNAAALSAEVQKSLANAKLDNGAKARAELIHGVNLFYTPPAYGGGADKALEMFEQSIASFDAQSEMPEVSWGEAEAYVWLGQVQHQLGNIDAATSAYEKAIAIDSNCAWASYLLTKISQ